MGSMMGRIQDKWDQAEESRRVRLQNEVCSYRLLQKLREHHGQVEEQEPVEVAPEPKPEPKPEPEPEPDPPAFAMLHKVELIKRSVCRQFNISKQLIESASRKSDVVRPRQIAMYLARKHTDHSFPEIGRRFGGRDHTTILHAFHKIGDLVLRDAVVAETVSELEAAIS
jgi:hypothetical protein